MLEPFLILGVFCGISDSAIYLIELAEVRKASDKADILISHFCLFNCEHPEIILAHQKYCVKDFVCKKDQTVGVLWKFCLKWKLNSKILAWIFCGMSYSNLGICQRSYWLGCSFWFSELTFFRQFVLIFRQE